MRRGHTRRGRQIAVQVFSHTIFPQFDGTPLARPYS